MTEHCLLPLVEKDMKLVAECRRESSPIKHNVPWQFWFIRWGGLLAITDKSDAYRLASREPTGPYSGRSRVSGRNPRWWSVPGPEAEPESGPCGRLQGTDQPVNHSLHLPEWWLGQGFSVLWPAGSGPVGPQWPYIGCAVQARCIGIPATWECPDPVFEGEIYGRYA